MKKTPGQKKILQWPSQYTVPTTLPYQCVLKLTGDVVHAQVGQPSTGLSQIILCQLLIQNLRRNLRGSMTMVMHLLSRLSM